MADCEEGYFPEPDDGDRAALTTTAEAVEKSIFEMQTLQRQREDYIWRPAGRAETALLMAREEIKYLRARLAEAEADTRALAAAVDGASTPLPMSDPMSKEQRS